MNKRAIVISFTLSLVLGVTVYAVYRFSVVILEKPPLLPEPSSLTTLRAPPSKQQAIGGFEAPPPPVGPTYEPSPERRRTLIGATNEQLKQIEQYLPEGAQVATYAVSETEERAAFASADLMADGRPETVIVYEAPGPAPDGGGQPLFLSVLALEGNGLILKSSARLYGGLIYISIYDRYAVPFAIRDVTGDGRSEIIVTSGVGASLGGAIQVYSFDGSSLHQLAFADGHVLRLHDKEITAQSRYEDKPRVYRWNGLEFEQAP